MPLSSTMTVLRLPGGGLVLHSPVAATAARRAAVDALGPVAHLYAPNLFHHRWIGEWAAAYPAARLHAPPGLARKRPQLRVDRVVAAGPHAGGAPPSLEPVSAEPAFAGVLEEIPIEGFRLREIALIHRPSSTLVVADLLHNVGRPAHPWAALYTRVMGFYDRPALSRVIRWTGFDDRGAARRCLRDLVARPFDRLVVGHGAPLPHGGRAALAAAYQWLLGPAR